MIIRGPDSAAPLGAYYESRVIQDAPLAYYRFGDAPGAATAADSSGHNLNGTYQNGSVTGVSGALSGAGNSAVQFNEPNDTSAYVALPSGFANFTAGLTLEIWIYPTAANRYARLFDLGNGASSDNIILGRRDTSNDLQLQIYRGATGGATLTASGVLEFNKWQHIVATVDAGGNARLYKNGIQVATGVINAPNNITRTSNFIARSNTSAVSTTVAAMMKRLSTIRFSRRTELRLTIIQASARAPSSIALTPPAGNTSLNWTLQRP